MSWSGEGATLRSPLEQVWRQFVPQGHDTALRNAFYNVAAAGFVAVAGAAAWHVYLIFQPFIRALLWAVLCGSALHPAKTTLVSIARHWLESVARSSTSLSIATLLLPLHTLDSISELVGRYVVRHVRTVVMVTVVLPVLFIVIHYTPTVLTSVLCWLLSTSFSAAMFVMSIVTSSKYVVVGLVCCYLASLFILWEQEQHKAWLSRLSVVVWVLAGAGVSGWVFSYSPLTQQIVFAVFCALLVLGLAVEVMEFIKQQEPDSMDSTTLVRSVVKVCRNDYGDLDSQEKECSSPPPLASVQEEENENSAEKCTPKVGGSAVEDLFSNDTQEKELLRPDSLTDTDESPTRAEDLNSSHNIRKSAENIDSSSTEPHPCPDEECASNFYIKAVFMACILVELWRHHYLLGLLPLAMIYYTIKKTTSVCLSGGSLCAVMSEFCDGCWTKITSWASQRRDALMPPPVRGVRKVLARTESVVMQVISGSLDTLVACCLILAMLVFIVSALIFLAVQIQGESMQLVGVGTQIFNATVVSNPQFLALLPEDIGDSMNSALDNAYHYGRDWIARWLRGMVGEADEEKAIVLEKQVLELWDRVYQAWVISPPQTPHMHGPVVTTQAVSDTFDNLLQGIANSPGLVSIDSITQVMKDNVGTILSVLESVWTLLLSNLSLVLSLAATSASTLVGSSLSLLNALISAVVFLTALFYVLSSAGDTYKPVSVLSNLAPGQMNSVGVAVEQAINGVFTASLKMGVFYGLWTWLLHSLFATNIVYIPAVLGALFGAVPLVGTYWACVPGMLELWWGHGSPALALLLLLCQLAPLSCVDTAIYAEIKGGGHPYLTGLAVGGGIFCWGAEGAILGPLLLCILLVATNMYTALIKPPPPANRFSRLRRNFTLSQ